MLRRRGPQPCPEQHILLEALGGAGSPSLLFSRRIVKNVRPAAGIAANEGNFLGNVFDIGTSFLI
jgi:hypothetical protein